MLNLSPLRQLPPLQIPTTWVTSPWDSFLLSDLHSRFFPPLRQHLVNKNNKLGFCIKIKWEISNLWESVGYFHLHFRLRNFLRKTWWSGATYTKLDVAVWPCNPGNAFHKKVMTNESYKVLWKWRYDDVWRNHSSHYVTHPPHLKWSRNNISFM